MKLTFLNDPKGLEPLIRETLDSLLHFNFSVVPIEVEVSFVEDPSELHDGEVAAGGGEGGEGYMRFRDDAPFFSAPITRSRTAEEKMRFFREVVIHEAAHVVTACLAEDEKTELAAMFGATPENWNPLDAAWEDRVFEGIAETFKDAFMPRHLRLYANRTRVNLSISRYAQFRQFWRRIQLRFGESAEQGWFGWSSVGWAYQGSLGLRTAHATPNESTYPVFTGAQELMEDLMGWEPIDITLGGYSTNASSMPGYPSIPNARAMIFSADDDEPRDFWVARGSFAVTDVASITSALEGGQIPIRWGQRLHLHHGQFQTWGANDAQQDARRQHAGSQYYRWRLARDGGGLGAWASVDPLDLVPLGTKIHPELEIELYPIWEMPGGGSAAGAPALITANMELTAVEALASDFPNAQWAGRIMWEYTGSDPTPDPNAEWGTLRGWSTSPNRFWQFFGHWDAPPSGATGLKAILVRHKYKALEWSTDPGSNYPGISIADVSWFQPSTAEPSWRTNLRSQTLWRITQVGRLDYRRTVVGDPLLRWAYWPTPTGDVVEKGGPGGEGAYSDPPQAWFWDGVGTQPFQDSPSTNEATIHRCFSHTEVESATSEGQRVFTWPMNGQTEDRPEAYLREVVMGTYKVRPAVLVAAEVDMSTEAKRVQVWRQMWRTVRRLPEPMTQSIGNMAFPVHPSPRRSRFFAYHYFGYPLNPSGPTPSYNPNDIQVGSGHDPWGSEKIPYFEQQPFWVYFWDKASFLNSQWLDYTAHRLITAPPDSGAYGPGMIFGSYSAFGVGMTTPTVELLAGGGRDVSTGNPVPVNSSGRYPFGNRTVKYSMGTIDNSTSANYPGVIVSPIPLEDLTSPERDCFLWHMGRVGTEMYGFWSTDPPRASWTYEELRDISLRPYQPRLPRAVIDPAGHRSGARRTLYPVGR